MLFNGAYAEVRAYSGFTPDVSTVKDQREITSLPFTESAMASMEGTIGMVDYEFLSASGGGMFRWNFAQLQDGAAFSFTVAEGQVAFQVDEPMPYALLGDYGYTGQGTKFARFQLYDGPQDANPVYEWRNSDSGVDPATYNFNSAGELSPGKDYRFVYRVLLDNPTLGEAGATAGTVEFSIGVPVTEVQPGDANGDGTVDLADLNLVRNNFGSSGPGVEGDTPPFDEHVDLGDLNAVRNHFGESLPSAVPEPHAIVLAICGTIAGAVTATSRRRGAAASRSSC